MATWTQLGVLNELISITGATQDTGAILSESLGIILMALAERQAGVYLREGEQWSLFAQRGLDANSLPTLQHLSAEDMPSCYRDAAHGQSIPLDTLATTHDPLAQTLRQSGYQALFTIPLIVRETVIGFLFVGLTSPLPAPWTDQDFLSTLGKTCLLYTSPSPRD